MCGDKGIEDVSKKLNSLNQDCAKVNRAVFFTLGIEVRYDGQAPLGRF